MQKDKNRIILILQDVKIAAMDIHYVHVNTL